MMPNITGYDAPALDIRPTEIGVESTAAAGRRVGVYGSQIAEAKRQEGQSIAGAVKTVGDVVNDYEAQREISTAAKHGADVMAKGSQSLNAFMTGADIPDDPSNPQAKKDELNARLQNPNSVQQWRDETLEPMLDGYRNSGFFVTKRGQDYADRFVATAREHFVTTALADQSTIAGHVTKDNLQKAADGWATAIFNDPHNLNTSVTQFRDMLDHMGGTVDAKTQSAIREWGEGEISKMVTAGVQGRILKGAPYDDIVKDYAPYINPGQNAMFERQQNFYQKGAAVAQKQEILLNKQIAETNAHAAINQSWGDNVKFDPETKRPVINPGFVRDMVDLPFKHPSAPDAVDKAKTYIDWAESQQKPPPRADNPATIDGLMKTIGDPSVSLDDAKIAIAKADIAKGLTKETGAQMVQLATDMRNLNNPLLTKTMEAAKEIVEPKYSGQSINPGGFAKFYYDFIHNQYLPNKVVGTLPPDALDMSQPNSMISKALAAATGGPAVTLPAAVSANGGVGGPPLPVYTAPKGAPTQQARPPEPGETRQFQGQTWRFKGGNWRDQKTWEPVS